MGDKPQQAPKKTIEFDVEITTTEEKAIVPYRKAPAASTTTSSTASDNRVIKAPTMFFP
jgi:hypothetical protein